MAEANTSRPKSVPRSNAQTNPSSTDPAEEGENVDPMTSLVRELREAIAFGRSVKKVSATVEAASLLADLDRHYGDRKEVLPTLFKGATGLDLLPLPHIATLYALLDQSTVIEVAHVEAASALWRFADDMVRYVHRDGGIH